MEWRLFPPFTFLFAGGIWQNTVTYFPNLVLYFVMDKMLPLKNDLSKYKSLTKLSAQNLTELI